VGGLEFVWFWILTESDGLSPNFHTYIDCFDQVKGREFSLFCLLDVMFIIFRLSCNQ